MREDRRPSATALQAELGKYTARSAGCRRRSTRSTSSRPVCNASSTSSSRARQGLLPQRAAARLHGADADGAAGHHAERRRRRELHARAEDGSVHDVPPGDRPARLREISAAVQDAPEPVGVRRQRLAASARRRPAARCATRGWGSSTSFSDASHYPSNAKQRQEWEEKYHWEEPHLWDYPMLPTNMTEASCAKCHQQEVYVPNAPKLDRRLRDVRARRLLRVPQDQGLREPAEARADPDEDQRQADAGLGEELDARSDARSRTSPGCRRSGTTRTATRRRTHPRNEAEINAAVAYLFANSETYTPAVAIPPRGDAEGGRADRRVDRLSRLPRHRRERSRGGRPAPHVRPAARRTSAARRPTSGSTTGSAIRSTTTRAPTCPTCG